MSHIAENAANSLVTDSAHSILFGFNAYSLAECALMCDFSYLKQNRDSFFQFI